MLHIIVFAITITNGFRFQLLSPDPQQLNGGYVKDYDQCFGPEDAAQNQWWYENIGKDLSRFAVKEENHFETQLTVNGPSAVIKSPGKLGTLKAKVKKPSKWKPSVLLGPVGFNHVITAMTTYAQIFNEKDKSSTLVHGYTRKELPVKEIPKPLDIIKLIEYFQTPALYLTIYIARLSITSTGVNYAIDIQNDVRFEPEVVPEENEEGHQNLHPLVESIMYQYIEIEQSKKNRKPPTVHAKYTYTPKMNNVHLVYEIIHPPTFRGGFKIINEDDLVLDDKVLVGRAMLLPDGNWNVNVNVKKMKPYLRKIAPLTPVTSIRKSSTSSTEPESMSSSNSQSGPAIVGVSYAPGFGDFDFLNSGEYTIFYVLIGVMVMIITCCCLFWIMMTIYCILCGILSSGNKSTPCLMMQSGDEQYV